MAVVVVVVVVVHVVVDLGVPGSVNSRALALK